MAIRIPLAVYGTMALASLALVPILDRPAFAAVIGIGIAAAFLGGTRRRFPSP